MIEYKIKLNQVDQARGDSNLPELLEENNAKSNNNGNSEQLIKLPKINIKHSSSNNSINSLSLSQKHNVTTQQTISKTTEQPRQHTDNQSYKISQFKTTTHDRNEYNFKMKTNSFSRIFMFDYLKLMIHLYKSMKKTQRFSYNDIPNLEEKDQTNNQYNIFSLIYYQRLEKSMYQNKPFTANDLLFVLIKTHLFQFIKLILLLVFFFSIKILSSLCIRELLNAISEDREKNEIFLYMILICFSLFVISILDQHYGRTLYIQFYSLRTILLKHIHTKVSSLSAFTISQNNLGKLMNLISNDLKVIEPKVADIVKLSILPLPTIAAGIISYFRFGKYAFVGLVFLILCIPIQTLLGRISKKFFQNRATINDKRMQITNEVMESIRLIKLYAWEEAFLKILNQIRSKDLYQLFGSKIVQAIEGSISLSSGIISCFLMFYLVYLYEDPSSLTMANMFSTLDIFLFLRQEVISSSGTGITSLLELQVVMKRVVNILLIESQEMLCINSKILIKNYQYIIYLHQMSIISLLQCHLIDLVYFQNRFIFIEILSAKSNCEFINNQSLILNKKLIALINEIQIKNIQRDKKESQISNSSTQNNDNLSIGEIIFNDFSAFWKLDSPVLEKITTSILPGELVAIIGPVSSGKTSLLSCLIKEIPYYTGQIQYKGKMAYVEQEPIIFNMSLRDNIVFGQEFDQIMYSNILNICHLHSDIEIMGGSDQFEIGEKGSNLSGGQRARVALARALYSNADIYVLDDPLSALDSNVSKQIFKNAIKTFLKGKTILITTHSLDFIHQSDKVLVIQNGLIIEQGQPCQLEKYLDEMQFHTLSRSPVDSPTQQKKQDSQLLELIHKRSKKEVQKIIKLQKDDSCYSLQSKHLQTNSQKVIEQHRYKSANVTTLISIQNLLEKNEENSKVTFKTYKTYFGYCKFKCLYPICLVLFMSNEVSYIFFTQTLGKFDGKNLDQYDELIMQLGIYSLAYFVILFLKRLLLNYLTNDINFQLHKQMIFACLRSKISFFDSTPVGNILNKFSSDLSCLDTNLPKQLQDSLEMVCNTLTLVGTIIYLNPYFIIVLAISILILILFFSLAKNVIIQTKQFELNLQTTVFTFFNTSIYGVLPIKLYNQTASFRQQFNHILDDSLRTSFTYWFSSKGFAMYIIFVTQISSIIGIFLAVALHNGGASLGQTITFFIGLSSKLQSGLRQMIQLDTFMSSAERAISLTQLESEPPLRTQFDNIFKQQRKSKRFSRISLESYSFPFKGKIEFKNVVMSYKKHKKPVLDGISFLIEPGKKVAFIGRTGAGKSSILQALYRMFEITKYQTQISSLHVLQIDDQILSQNVLEVDQIQPTLNQNTFRDQKEHDSVQQNGTDGYIKIDDHSISDIGIQTLRDGFAIIPQIPFIFTGTIRMNIDPFQKYTDNEIWTVINEIQLEEKVKSFPKGLSTEISNSSESFSAGQKQLICLGRAMLKKSKILVLDEVTSNCDAQTEDLIIALIKKNFVGSTIITIAHRLHTIADYDEVIVLDQGKIAEQGSPEDLLKQKNGIFTNMVQCSGDKSSKLILELSKKKMILTQKNENMQQYEQNEESKLK